ncbi:MAG TPA: carbohydrate kinase [Thermoguttaceae bacterium]|nr:carbohydrate kinase [Thermoguttaceae bacterium]
MNQDKRPVVVGLGEVLWDMLPDGKQFGGAPANFAYHAQALGADANVVSCVGDDDLGSEILDRLDGLQLSHDDVARTDQHPTGTVSVELDADGKPDYVIHEPVAWDVIPWSERLTTLAAQADAVCFGSLAQRSPVSRQTIRDFLAATPAECLRIFDINLRQHYYSTEIIADSLQTANILKLNDEELPEIARLLSIPGDERDVLKTLRKQFDLALIALTKGDRGSVLLTADDESIHPGQPAEIADTVGAGDAFTAVIAMSWMQGRKLDAINAHANRVASFVCSKNGATPEMPSELRELGQ